MQTLKRYNALILFTVFFLLGMIIRYTLGEKSTLWSLWSAIDISFAVVLGVLAFIAYKEMIHQKDLIRLIFYIDEKVKIDTGLCLVRQHCTRSEVMGLLTLLKKEDKTLRYSIKNLHKLLDAINDIQTSKKEHLYIPITKEELHQYEIKDVL